MSDLQCPATLLIVEPCTGDSAQPLAAALTQRNVAAVYAWPVDQALETAEVVGARLAAATRVLDDGAGPAGGGPLGVLQELADLHRGETVVVVGAAVSSALGRTAGRREVLELRVDADGWHRTTWSCA